MSTQAVPSGPSSGGQSMLANKRAREQSQPETEQQKKGANRMVPFFPLGYKDAVYQWVCTLLVRRF